MSTRTRIPPSIGAFVVRMRALAAHAADRWSPRLRIGVAIDQTSIRAVGLQFNKVVWGLETPRHENDAIADALTACLASRPKGRPWAADLLTPTVTIALGATHAQTKRLIGLPPLADPRLMARAVREHVGRFFLKNGIPLVTTTVRTDGPDAAWAAAFEEPLVAALTAACEQSRVGLRAVVPAVDVVSLGLVATSDETVLWPDGDATVAISWSRGRLATVRRAPATLTIRRATPVPAIASLGDEAWRFAAAYGAAMGSMTDESGASTTLAFQADGRVHHPVHQRRLAAAAIAAALSLAAATLAPGIAARRAEQQAAARLAALAPRETQALSVARDLGLVTSALGEVAAFEASGRTTTTLLRDLANALPSGAALLAVHLDSLDGSIVAIAPRAGAVVTPLDHIAWLASPEIVGPVTREKAGVRDVERVTVRFRWAQPAAGRP